MLVLFVVDCCYFCPAFVEFSSDDVETNKMLMEEHGVQYPFGECIAIWWVYIHLLSISIWWCISIWWVYIHLVSVYPFGRCISICWVYPFVEYIYLVMYIHLVSIHLVSVYPFGRCISICWVYLFGEYIYLVSVYSFGECIHLVSVCPIDECISIQLASVTHILVALFKVFKQAVKYEWNIVEESLNFTIFFFTSISWIWRLTASVYVLMPYWWQTRMKKIINVSRLLILYS